MSAATVVLILALGLEFAIGDPVSRWHPVALFGRGIDAGVRRAPRHGMVRCLLYGGVMVAIGVGGMAVGSALVLAGLDTVSPVAALLVGAILLKTSFSYRQLEGKLVPPWTICLTIPEADVLGRVDRSVRIS